MNSVTQASFELAILPFSFPSSWNSSPVPTASDFVLVEDQYYFSRSTVTKWWDSPGYGTANHSFKKVETYLIKLTG